MEGWIKLHRKLLEWEWYDDINVVRLFLHLLLTANYEQRSWHGKKIERGSLITGRIALAQETSLTEQQVRTALKKLESTGEITTTSTNQFTIITINNYESYQSMESSEQPTNNQRTTNEQPTNNQRITTTKEIKNKRNKEDNKEYISDESDMHAPAKQKRKKYGEYNNVLLTDEEAEKLKAEYGEDTPYIVENYSQYKEMKGYKCKRDYLAIRKWGANAYYEQLKKQENGINNGRSTGSIQERAARIAEYAFAANGM